jgi:hypothetical protein
MGERGLDVFGSGYGKVAYCCEYNIEISGFVK